MIATRIINISSFTRWGRNGIDWTVEFMRASTGASRFTNSKKTLNAEDTFDMAMSLEEADAILAAAGFADSEAELELV